MVEVVKLNRPISLLGSWKHSVFAFKISLIYTSFLLCAMICLLLYLSVKCVLQ